MNQPGLRIEDVFKRVRAGVRKGSGGKQIPWENTSLEGDFYFKPGKAGETPPQQVASIAPTLAPHARPRRGSDGETWTDPTTGMEFVWVPGGCFKMGSPTYEKNRKEDERQQDVCVEGFWLGKYEVTVGQYKKFRSDHGDSDDKLPVNKVNWQDAIGFAAWLSEKSGMKIRLPTEAEWEYAARAGTTTAYFWGDSFSEGYGNYDKSPFAFAGRKPVGSYKPNAFGLYDMIGNVYEWTASVYDENYSGGEQRVADAGTGGSRVVRGGSWPNSPRLVRSAFRSSNTPDYRSNGIGLRLSRIP